jgi:hypothetical protein
MSAFPRWNEEERNYLRTAWGRVPTDEIVSRLGRSEAAVRQEAYKLLGTTLDRPPMRWHRGHNRITCWRAAEGDRTAGQ